MPTNDPEPEPMPDLKIALECEKLRAEIEAIRRPLRSTPAFYATVGPVMLAIAGVIITWQSGWFDVQRTKIENQNALVEARTERLKADQTRLEIDGVAQRAVLAKAVENAGQLKAHEDELIGRIATLSRDRNELQKTKELLESEIHRLASSDTKVSLMVDELKKIQAERDLLTGQLQDKETALQTLAKKNEKQVAMIRRANDIFEEATTIILRDKTTWEKFAGFIDRVRLYNHTSIEYLPEWNVTP